MQFNRREMEKSQKAFHGGESTVRKSLSGTKKVYSGSSGSVAQPVTSSTNAFASLPGEISSSFEKMIEQLEIIKNTLEVFNQRITTVESQVAQLYNTQKVERQPDSEQIRSHRPDSDRLPENEEYQPERKQFVSNMFGSEQFEQEEYEEY